MSMSLRRKISIGVSIIALISYALVHLPTNTKVSPVIHSTYGTSASSTSLIIEPDAGISPVLSLIQHASSSVDMVMYQLEDTAVEQALAEDVSRGVVVRVLLNDGYYGTKENTKNDPAFQYLAVHGVSVRATPARFALTHEKSMVIDNTQGIIMTMNLTPQYYKSGREFVVLDSDANDVSAMETTFDADWNNTSLPAPNGDSLIWSPGSENALIALIESARTSLDIYNEEMADTKIIHALASAATRGVSVRVVMTYSSNWKKAFTELTGAGVAVRTYAQSASLYIHAKVIIRDGTQAFLGSENFSSNSLNKNRELGLIVVASSTINTLQNTFEKDWSGASAFGS